MEPTQSLEPDEPTGAGGGPSLGSRGGLAVEDPGLVGRSALAVDGPGLIGGGAADDADSAGRGALAVDGDLVIDELLVEEISIDGMCGVY